MFRSMRRNKQQLSPEECSAILTQSADGVLAVQGDDGYPYAVPLNYIYENGVIYIHCAQQGHKLDAIRRSDKVSFCVVSERTVCEEKFTAFYKSVIVFGSAVLVTDDAEKRDAVRALAQRLCPTQQNDSIENEIQHDWDRLAIIRITPAHISGKQCIEFLQKNK